MAKRGKIRRKEEVRESERRVPFKCEDYPGERGSGRAIDEHVTLRIDDVPTAPSIQLEQHEKKKIDCNDSRTPVRKNRASRYALERRKSNG